MNQKIEFVLRTMEPGVSFRSLCQEFGISAKTGYKWRARFLERGKQGLEEESRRPRKSPTLLGEKVACAIIALKRAHPAWGPRKIRIIYGRTHAQTPSESSFKRVLQQAGFTETRRARRREESGRLYSGRRAQGPNEIWTVDFKGWWYGSTGRCEPLTIRDEFSRYLLELRALPNARTPTVRGAFERLFELRGLPGAIRSDNGAPFAHVASVLGLSQLSAWWVALGIDLERGRPGCPQDNGAHERLHLDISRELEARRLEQQAVLDEWRRTFNEERPHEALNMRTPAQVYTPSIRRFEGTPEDLRYEGMETRKVQKAGHIVWAGQQIFISTAFRGWSVGMAPGERAGRWSIWFGRLRIGHWDESTASFEPVCRGETIRAAHALERNE